MPPIPPDAMAIRLADLCVTYLRPHSGYATDSVTGDPIITFDPPLTSAEQTTFDRLANVAKSRVLGITPAEWQALEPDIAGLKTYLGLASPTAAQTASATKAIIRVLAAMLRD